MKAAMPRSSRPSLSTLKEVCLYIQDTAQTRRFYEGLLGLPCLTERPGEYAFFHAGPVMLLCFVREYALANLTLPAHGAKGPQHIAFEASSAQDYEQWKAYLPTKGLRIDREVTWPSGRRSFYFWDPDGHSIEILEPGIWPTP